MRKFSVLVIKNHRSAAVRGGRAPGAPPPLDPLVQSTVIIFNWAKWIVVKTYVYLHNLQLVR